MAPPGIFLNERMDLAGYWVLNIWPTNEITISASNATAFIWFKIWIPVFESYFLCKARPFRWFGLAKPSRGKILSQILSNGCTENVAEVSEKVDLENKSRKWKK
jgi:hypothetical protein